MNSAAGRAQIPAALAALADQPRVLVRRGGPPRKGGACVVYWMQRAVRSVDNPALDVAIEAANILGLPVVIYFGVIPNYPNANLRHYYFLQQGLHMPPKMRPSARSHSSSAALRIRSKRFSKKFARLCSSAMKIPVASPSAGAARLPAGSEFLFGRLTPTSSCPRASSTAALLCCIIFGRASRRSCRDTLSRSRPRGARTLTSGFTRSSRAFLFWEILLPGLQSSIVPSSPSTRLPVALAPRCGV